MRFPIVDLSILIVLRSRDWQIQNEPEEVWFDQGNAEYVVIEDGVHIANRCLLLCHQRDFTDYRVGAKYTLHYRILEEKFV